MPVKWCVHVKDEPVVDTILWLTFSLGLIIHMRTAPWCGHCKQLAPQWEAAAKKLKGLVRFAAVNCDVEENKQLAGLYGIRGFPTIKVFGAEHAPNPYQAGKPFKEVVSTRLLLRSLLSSSTLLSQICHTHTHTHSLSFLSLIHSPLTAVLPNLPSVCHSFSHTYPRTRVCITAFLLSLTHSFSLSLSSLL
jgi:thiol-disulfide isomerase/thioredoxin